ncbi:MAG: putative porin [Candidatus Omnitrophica bacterium]|nr:putative porin [Candidatus Omnitrophota bacterium]
MNSVMGVGGKRHEDLAAGLIRKQIDCLTQVLCALESEKALDKYFFEHLMRIEQQLHWLRTVALHFKSFLTISHRSVNSLRKEKRMKRIGIFGIMAAMFVFMTTPSQAGEMDVLLEKLVEKGVLTQMEANVIKQETKEQVSRDLADMQSYSVPEWVQRIKMKGDMRLRYQYEKTETSATSRSRGRTRFRLGLETRPTKQFKVGAGLASGGTDPRSTNVTWENTFERPDIRLDYAYAQYEPAAWVKMVGGKFLFPDYFWQTTDMLFDTDINPYGGSVHLEHQLIPDVDGFVNAGSWILDEISASKRADPFMGYIQGGVQHKGDKFDAKIAGTYFSFNGVKGYDLDNELNTNTQVSGADGVLKYDYDAGGISAEFGVKGLFGGLPKSIDERIALFGDYIHNPDPDEQNNGWAAGLVFGNEKIAEKGQWQMKYQYVTLGKDAFPDTFPDSDRYGGRTDVRGHEVIWTLGLAKNVTFGVDYYTVDRIKAASNPETIVQGDLVLKF